MSILATGITALGLAMLLVLNWKQSTRAPAAKALASVGFVALALTRDATAGGYGRLILVGLIAGLVGDLFLELRAAASFLLGLGAFLLGHLAYMGAFALDQPDWVLTASAAGALAVFGLGVARWLKPHLTPHLRIPVLIYIVVILAMTATGIGLADHRLLASMGAVAFLASDLAVARERFIQPGFVNSAWGLPLYYLGQVLLAWSI
ncbi:MAG TPA: lysoplasmalogenase [Acidimicrobiia bacterium]|nr:lysoplasmalogenase [Acidimicrobiia bacterium]